MVNLTNKNDIYDGTADPDVVYGLQGKDVISGAGGDDQIYGGNAEDRVSGGDGRDSVYGENGDDVVYGNAGGDQLSGGNGNDKLLGDDPGQAYNDALFGDNGDDTLDGGGDEGEFSVAVAGDPVEWPVNAGGNGHYYEAVSVNGWLMWQEAAAAAAAKGGHLVTITSAAENGFVFSLIDSNQYWYHNEPTSGNSIGPWIGGHQDPNGAEPRGSWEWVNGEGYFMDTNGDSALYTNWHGGEPNNGLPDLGNEDALHFFALGNNRSEFWNDFPDDGRVLAGTEYGPVAYIIEYDSPPGSGGEVTFDAGDELTGGLGVDRFIHAVGSGTANVDLIKDFQLGVDKIVLSGIAAADVVLIQQGQDTLIAFKNTATPAADDLRADDAILVQNTIIDPANDFIFT